VSVAPDRDAFRAVADPRRRAILDVLASGERSVTDLCGLFDVTQSAVSQHLRLLREAGLVRTRRDGRLIYYALDAAPLRQVYDWAAHYERFWTCKLDALGAVLDREAGRARRGRGRRS
jgi:DNA-binding transcriptional ArsR family regulator